MIEMEEFRLRAHLETATLQAWIDARWLIPRGEAPSTSFSEADLARARLIRELTDDLGVNDDAVPVILSLIDQIHGLRRSLRGVLEAIHAQPEAVQRAIAGEGREGRSRSER